MNTEHENIVTSTPPLHADEGNMHADFEARNIKIGQKSIISQGVFIAEHSNIGCNVYIGPNASVGGSRPNANAASDRATVIEDDASIGSLVFIANGLRIGSNATILEGAVVTKSVPPNAIVAGNPAYIQGYSTRSPPERATVQDCVSRDEDASIVSLPVFADIRGALTVGNFLTEIPFLPSRFFIVYGVPSRETRGEHAHKVCHQFLICVSGSCRVLADNGHVRQDIVLDSPHKGLHLPPMTWGTQYDYSQDAVLLVFASHPYDSNEYIRTYEEFIRTVKD